MPKTAQKDASVATVKKQGAAMKHIKKYWQWYAMMLIPVVYYIVFRYIPMFGNIIAFRRYRAGSSIFGDEWSGLKYFNQFMKDQNFWRAFKNTLLLNFKYLIISFPLTLIFALLLNHEKAHIPRAGYRHGAVSGCLRRLRQLHGCKHQHRWQHCYHRHRCCGRVEPRL